MMYNRTILDDKEFRPFCACVFFKKGLGKQISPMENDGAFFHVYIT